MIKGSDRHINKLILSLLVFLGFASALFSQTKISGIINEYGHVTGIGTDYVIVNDPVQFAKFAVGDTVLLIQMKGSRIYSFEASLYGFLESSYGKPGKHEFLLISALDGGTKKITFTSNLINVFSVEGALQIIKVPSFKNSAVVDNADLTCAPWDSTGKTGGVLTVIVGKTLYFNKNIDVSGKGFTGGATTLGIGVCTGLDLKLDKYVYSSVYDTSGYKGESPVSRGYLALSNYPPIYPGYFKGKGANFTGGGGGNGRFSGGGGGANYGAGGKGGLENFDCLPLVRSNGGSGGLQLKLTPLDGDIFMGGGGGSSTYLTGSTPTAGGNGGGIVIIICDEIQGNGNSIIAKGVTTTPVQASSNAGSGGGGGGGSVAIYLQSFSTSALTISANGGKGGNSTGQFGEGGGGGGGLIKISNISIPGTVTRTVSFGGHGTRSGGFTAGDGAAGESLTNFIAVLNGFLFNIIRSSVTGNQVDSICSNMMPQKITGTKPIGGSSPYTYLWEKSYDEITWTPLTNDTDPVNYTPTVIETATVYFRRTITDSSIPVLTDRSKSVKIIVQPFIKNNIVGTSDTICFAQDPPAFSSKATLQDGNGKYAFKWKVSLDNSLFILPVNTYNTEGYTPPPALGVTSWYRRTVTSGRCVDSTAFVKITVLPVITGNNILNTPPDICYGSIFANITATTSPTLAGGDNVYKFKWESSANAITWISATGISNLPGYDPDELSSSFPGIEYYRRVVYSGSNDVCVNTSTSVLLKDFPVITNNTISANQTICSGSAPAKLIGSTPLNGDGTYKYTWQDSTKSQTWTDIPGAINITIPDYQPPVLSDTTRYRRIVFSSACSDISKSIKIIVHKPILNNNITLLAGGLTDTTICNGAVPHLLKGTVTTGGTNIPGDYAYLWFVSTDNATWNTAPGAGTLVSYQPPSLTAATYYYKRQVSSGACLIPKESSATITLTVLPSITNNTISGKTTVCYNTVPIILAGSSPAGGTGTYSYLWEQSVDGTTWTPAAGTNNSSTGNYQPPALTIPMSYKRTVKSGANDCCSVTSAVFNLTIDALPTGTITSNAPIIICEGSTVPLDISLTGTPPWIIVYNENSAQVTVPGVTSVNTTLLASPVTGTALTTYNYSLFSVEDNNGCLATSLSGTKKADVYKVPVANAGPDVMICGPKITLTATPSYGTGTWSSLTAIIPPPANTPSLTLTIDSIYAGSNIIYKFIWKELNWQCTNKDSVNITFDKRILVVNPAGPDTSLFSFDNIIHMVGKPLQTWETGLWTVKSGTGDFYPDNSPQSEVRNLSKGLNTYLWTIINGSCKLQDIVNISVYNIMIPEGFSPNNDPGNYNNTFIITGLDLPNQDAELNIVNGAGAEVFSTSNLDGQNWSDWDGKNSNGFDLPEGTYYYLLKLISKGPEKQVFKRSGFIILKRY